jgi:hypothetical protein
MVNKHRLMIMHVVKWIIDVSKKNKEYVWINNLEA